MNLLNNISLSVNSNGTYLPFSSEAWGYAGQMTLLGMVMVFAVLAILWLVLTLFKVVFADRSSKSEKKKESLPEVNNMASTVSDAHDDSELIAVITAAVATYMSEEKGENVPTDAFRVVSFRRANATGRSWNDK